MRREIIFATALCVVVGAWAVWWFSGSRSDGEDAGPAVLRSRRISDGAQENGKKAARRALRRKPKSAVSKTRIKPRVVELDDSEEKELTDLAKKILVALQAALDSEDISQIRDIISMVRNSPKGSLSKFMDGMPLALRKRLIEALGWFGNDAIPDLMEFLADMDPDAAQMAADQFQQALEDITLGDRERAEIVVAASQVMTDSDFLESIFMEIANMRNSVAAQAIVDILTHGTEKAKELILETMEFVTGEDNIQTIEDLEKWLAENPDGPDDDDLYGPMDDGRE